MSDNKDVHEWWKELREEGSRVCKNTMKIQRGAFALTLSHEATRTSDRIHMALKAYCLTPGEESDHEYMAYLTAAELEVMKLKRIVETLGKEIERHECMIGGHDDQDEIGG